MAIYSKRHPAQRIQENIGIARGDFYDLSYINCFTIILEKNN
jgi:hypothetical protein